MIHSRIQRIDVISVGLLLCLCLACARPHPREAIDPSEDSARQRAMVDAIGAALAGPMQNRSPQEALLVRLEDLYESLSPDQRRFMEAIRNLDGADPALPVASGITWHQVEGQHVTGPSGDQEMGLQLLPPEVWNAFRDMNEAMQTDLGRGLVIGSGYRTPANQLFIFVSYMPYYDYSPRKTLPHVSLPGASDHNRVERQGIDFVSESGVDLRYSDAEAFRALDEYRWLSENASRLGFVGEPPGGPSPWHWHFSDAQ